MTPTPEGKQLAADLANALDVIGRQADWVSGQPWSVPVLETDAKNRVAYAVAVKLFAEALADLREIDQIATDEGWAGIRFGSKPSRAAAIAAKWRVETDPLVEAMSVAMCGVAGEYYTESAKALRAELSKRGYEIGRKS